MSAPDWLSYVGAITGVAGSIMGYVGYRRSGLIKALDLRLELRKAEIDLRASIPDLVALLGTARKSRDAILAATGMFQSGPHLKWREQYDGDYTEALKLAEGSIPPDTDHASASHTVLEANLVGAYALRKRVEALRARYSAGLAEDDRQRDRLRAQKAV